MNRRTEEIHKADTIFAVTKIGKHRNDVERWQAYTLKRYL
jgi:hypothetical protein